MELLLQQPHNRYDFFRTEPRFQPIREFGLKMEKALWHVDEIDTSKDYKDYLTLSENERLVLDCTLAFFASSDGILFENCEEEIHEIKWPDVKYFYGFKAINELVHARSYGNQIETLIIDEVKKDKLFDSIFTIPIIKKKAEWAVKHLSSTQTLAHRLLASICVEGIFFSSSFATLFWFRHIHPGKLDGVCGYNDLISRDENLHVDFSVMLYTNYVQNKLTEKEVHELFADAVKIEEEFSQTGIPTPMIGINHSLMSEHIRSIANGRLRELGYSKLYSDVSKTPFQFMELLTLEPKKNFFETRVTEYQKIASRKGNIVNDIDQVDF